MTRATRKFSACCRWRCRESHNTCCLQTKHTSFLSRSRFPPILFTVPMVTDDDSHLCIVNAEFLLAGFCPRTLLESVELYRCRPRRALRERLLLLLSCCVSVTGLWLDLDLELWRSLRKQLLLLLLCDLRFILPRARSRLHERLLVLLSPALRFILPRSHLRPRERLLLLLTPALRFIVPRSRLHERLLVLLSPALRFILPRWRSRQHERLLVILSPAIRFILPRSRLHERLLVLLSPALCFILPRSCSRLHERLLLPLSCCVSVTGMKGNWADEWTVWCSASTEVAAATVLTSQAGNWNDEWTLWRSASTEVSAATVLTSQAGNWADEWLDLDLELWRSLREWLLLPLCSGRPAWYNVGTNLGWS